MRLAHLPEILPTSLLTISSPTRATRLRFISHAARPMERSGKSKQGEDDRGGFSAGEAHFRGGMVRFKPPRLDP
jgi:hypothetical protein